MLSVIAKIVENSNTVGYRLIDSNHKKTKDVSKEALEKVIMSGVNVEGAGIRNNKLVATNGSFKRYSSINYRGALLDRPSLVVLHRVDGGFICCDYRGKIGKYRECDVVAYSKSNGIANGKVVSNGGSEYISSISGEYTVLKEGEQTVENEAGILENNTNIVVEKKINSDINYRTSEHIVSEIIVENRISVTSDLSYRTFIKIMNTIYAEEKEVGWFESEAEKSLRKLRVTILKDGYDFIVEYKSLRIVKAKKMGTKLGECYVTVIYKDGICSRCYAHEESIEDILESLGELYKEYSWRDAQLRFAEDYWGGNYTTDRVLACIKGVNTGYWYVPTSNKQLINGLELVINRIDGCCYLAVSEHTKSEGIECRRFQLVLKFKSLEYGMQYHKEVLGSKFRESVEKVDMFKVADNSYSYNIEDAYKYTGPYTYLRYCYRNSIPINEDIYMRYYGKTTDDFGIVHPDICNKTIKTIVKDDRFIQPVYKISKYCYICKNTRTGEYVTHNVGYLDKLRVKNQLMEYKEEPLSNIISEEQIYRINKTNYDAKQRGLMIGLEVEGGDSVEMFNTRKNSVYIHVTEYMRINSITLFGVSVTHSGGLVVDGEHVRAGRIKNAFSVMYFDINKGIMWGGNGKRFTHSVILKSIDRVWEG